MSHFDRDIKGLVANGFTRKEAVMHIQQRIDQYVDKTNDSIASLNDHSTAAAAQRTGHLITLSVLLITATGIFVSQQLQHQSPLLDSTQKGQVVATFLLFIASIFSGVADYFTIRDFYKKVRMAVGNNYEEIATSIRNGEYDSMDEIYTQQSRLLKLEKSSSEVWSILQMILAGLGIICFLGLLTTVLRIF